ncbi:response regulator [Verrucomicrobiota bacterium]
MNKHKVMIVDDHATTRRQLAGTIRKEGWEVVTAEDGKEGLALFSKELPEIVVTDLKMPRIDGLQLIDQIKSIAPHVKLILITAFGETNVAIQAMRKGVLAYLKKPIDLELLIAALERGEREIVESQIAGPFPVLLVVEDKQPTRNFIVNVLEQENWQVHQAVNGKEALAIFRQRKIDVVLLDIVMPGKDGLRTLQQMRALTDDFEAIILTGHGDESHVIQAVNDGAADFLEKPVEGDQLVSVIQVALEKLSTTRACKYRAGDFQGLLELDNDETT